VKPLPKGATLVKEAMEVWARSIAEELTQLDAGHVEEDP
jgi:hypothetical protein